MTTVPQQQTDEHAASPDKHEAMTARLTAPLLMFDFEAEIKQLQTEELWLKNGRISKTLVKHADFRILLILMKAGTLMQEHKTDARLSLQTLSGRLLIKLDEQTVELPTGNLLVLEKAISHDVNALEESAFLLSISWPNGVGQAPPVDG